MNKISCAVFVKTPGVSSLKTRLASDIGRKLALDFYAMSINAIEEVLKDTLFIEPYWAVAEGEVCFPYWDSKGMGRMSQGQGELGDRLNEVYSNMDTSLPRVIIGSDAPQITQATFRKACELAKEFDFVIGPSTDGGFYLLLGNRDIPKSAWCSVPYSESTTCEQLALALKESGTVGYLTELSDVDYLSDFVLLRKELDAIEEDLNPGQRKIRQWIQEFTDTAPSDKLVGQEKRITEDNVSK